MVLKKPCAIIVTGIAGVGKTAVTEPLCKKHHIYFLDKDALNRPALVVNPTTQNRLIPAEEYMNDIIANGQAKRFLGFNNREMLQLPFPTGKPEEAQLGEVYGRHALPHVYFQDVNLTIGNLPRGLSTLFEFPKNRVKDGTLAGMLSGPNPFPEKITDEPSEIRGIYPNFRGIPTPIIHVYTQERILRQRLIDRAKADPHAAERNKGMVDLEKSFEEDELFKKHLAGQPVLWPELDFYNHLVVDNSQDESHIPSLTKQIEKYIDERSQGRDELLYRVDEQGNILGAVHFSVAHPPDKTKPHYSTAHPSDKTKQGTMHGTSDSFISRTDKRKKIACALRKGKVNKPGVWGNSCGGHIIYGTTPLETIKDEANDELFNNQGLPLGLDFKLARTITKQTHPNDPTYSVFYEAVYPGPFNPGKEVERVEFFDVEELRRDIATSPKRYTSSLPIELKRLPC